MAGCPLRPLTRPVSAAGCWLHGCSSFTAGGACGPAIRVPVLGVETVSVPPPLPRSPVFAQGLQWPHSMGSSLAAATMEKVGWVRQESVSSHTLHAPIQSSGYSVVLALNVIVHIAHR